MGNLSMLKIINAGLAGFFMNKWSLDIVPMINEKVRHKIQGAPGTVIRFIFNRLFSGVHCHRPGYLDPER
jgi:hypothetical protein